MQNIEWTNIERKISNGQNIESKILKRLVIERRNMKNGTSSENYVSDKTPKATY